MSRRQVLRLIPPLLAAAHALVPPTASLDAASLAAPPAPRKPPPAPSKPLPSVFSLPAPSLRASLVSAAQSMNASGLNHGTAGNLSARHGDGFLITPSGVPYATMGGGDVAAVDLRGESSYYGGLPPSSEWRFHRDVYLNFPEAGAIVHTHSPYASALSCVSGGIPPFHYYVALFGGKCVPRAAYATFGSQELSDNIVAALREHGVCACLMGNHGVVVVAASVEKALALAGEVENLARMLSIARGFGEVQVMSDEEMEVVLAKVKTYGKKDVDLGCMCEFDRKHRIVPPPRGDA
ncbi:hypothetical protein TeGR_g3682 [Tetraparma gracilis]|uniref:Class II aldolase/adducin N-terminal domain-containing protein n=1 Tax=Tetraparma gracilis TaxID=2962635 RepID=A0ABQ6NEE2_9STRA|nr:hypothetical protein TeGR_g3682 [Tetraparma gracilis]